MAGLYRLGYAPNPLDWTPWEYVKGTLRYDDPLARYRVMYASPERRTCFLEVLAPLRPKLSTWAAYMALADGDAPEDPPRPVIDARWRRVRAVGLVRPAPGQRWLDVRAPETCEALRVTLAPDLVRLGLADFDMGAALSVNRALTQAISRWAFERGFQGIVYPSRYDVSRTCWAIFEGAALSPLATRPIAPDDPDLVAVAALFGLDLADA